MSLRVLSFAVIADFGIAKAVTEATGATLTA